MVIWVRGLTAKDAPMLKKRSSLKFSMKEYATKRAKGGNMMAQYEIAKVLIEEGKPIGQGDIIEYVVVASTSTRRDIKIATRAVHTSHLIKGQPLDRAHYMKRLVAVNKRLEVFFDKPGQVFPDWKQMNQMNMFGTIFDANITNRPIM